MDLGASGQVLEGLGAACLAVSSGRLGWCVEEYSGPPGIVLKGSLGGLIRLAGGVRKCVWGRLSEWRVGT